MGEPQPQALVEYMAKALADDADAVEVDVSRDGRGVVYELRVAPGDIGKMIGRSGRTVQAMRAVLSVAATRLHERAELEIVEDD